MDKTYSCFVMDSAGFLIMHEDFLLSSTAASDAEYLRLTQKEKYIAPTAFAQGHRTMIMKWESRLTWNQERNLLQLQAPFLQQRAFHRQLSRRRENVVDLHCHLNIRTRGHQIIPEKERQINSCNCCIIQGTFGSQYNAATCLKKSLAKAHSSPLSELRSPFNANMSQSAVGESQQCSSYSPAQLPRGSSNSVTRDIRGYVKCVP